MKKNSLSSLGLKYDLMMIRVTAYLLDHPVYLLAPERQDGSRRESLGDPPQSASDLGAELVVDTAVAAHVSRQHPAERQP